MFKRQNSQFHWNFQVNFQYVLTNKFKMQSSCSIIESDSKNYNKIMQEQKIFPSLICNFKRKIAEKRDKKPNISHNFIYETKSSIKLDENLSLFIFFRLLFCKSIIYSRGNTCCIHVTYFCYFLFLKTNKWHQHLPHI